MISEGSGVGVREQLQRSVPCGAGCVDEVVGGAPDDSDGEEDEGGLGAAEPGRVHFVGEVDGEVGDARRFDEPKGHLHRMALAILALSGGRVPELRDARRVAQYGPIGKSGTRGGGYGGHQGGRVDGDGAGCHGSGLPSSKQ